jgi:hypothetical protein
MREITELLTEARRQTLDLVARLSDDVMHKPLDPIVSPQIFSGVRLAKDL